MTPFIPKTLITAKITTSIGSTNSMPMTDIMSSLQKKSFLYIALDIGIASDKDKPADKKA